MKSVKLLLVAVLTTCFIALPAIAAQKAKAPAAASIVVLEAMWTAGGPEYRAAVNQLADAYTYRMDARCRAPLVFSVAPAAQAYRVYTPKGAEAERDRLILKQVATLACIGAVGEKRASALL